VGEMRGVVRLKWGNEEGSIPHFPVGVT